MLGALDMTIADGEIISLLGDEGSGKTTFIKVIGGVTECEGEVLVDKKPISQKTDDTIIVFDDLAVFDNKTFYYNLAYPLKIRGYAKDDIDTIVKDSATRLGITACLYEKVRKMPLIDVKRLAIARLLIRRARVILIDDITGGLSKEDADTLWREVAPILIEKAREGMSIIYSTANKQEAISIADRIAVMHYGEIKQVGTYDEIMSKPANIWAVEALDSDYHFERAHVIKEGDKLIANLNDIDSNSDNLHPIDVSHLKDCLIMDCDGKDVYVGWHSSDYLNDGGRVAEVKYTIRQDKGYILHISDDIRVHSDKNMAAVCTLPKADSVSLFDIIGENSIIR